jgi:hypothetical protein
MDRKQILALEALIAAGFVSYIYIKGAAAERRLKLARINDIGWKANTLKDIDARIELGLAFEEIVKDLD